MHARRPAWFRPRSSAVLVAPWLCALLLWPAGAEARPDKKFTVGFGIAGTSVSGDLDGSTVLARSGSTGPQVLLAEPGNGGGLFALAMFQMQAFFAVEGLFLVTGHQATHESTPGRLYDMGTSSLLGGGRFMLPLGENFELFGRAGLGLLTVSYTGNATLPPNPTLLNSSFSGPQVAAGAGVAAFFDPLGAELGVLFQRGRLSDMTAAGTSTTLDPDLAVGLTTVTLTLTMHFGSL